METWEPLPKRQRKASRSNVDQPIEKAKPASSHRPAPSQSIAEKIEANIQARSSMLRADTSLTSKDGCAGQFYECTNLPPFTNVFHIPINDDRFHCKYRS